MSKLFSNFPRKKWNTINSIETADEGREAEANLPTHENISSETK